MVYFVKLISTGRVKIGYSANVPVRMQELTCEHGPIELLAVLHGSRKTERAHHLHFAKLRARGEWFEPGDSLMDYIASLRSCEPVGPVVRAPNLQAFREAHHAGACLPAAPAALPPIELPRPRLTLVETSAAPRWPRSRT
jgi:hypothetical protein